MTQPPIQPFKNKGGPIPAHLAKAQTLHLCLIAYIQMNNPGHLQKLMVTGAEMSAGLKIALTWSNPVGPLSGKTGVGVIAWIVSWVILHTLWKDKEMDFGKVFTATLILIALGFLFTFPPFFGLFAAE